MKILFTKASGNYWYKIIDCVTIDALYNNSEGYGVILEENWYTDDNIFKHWKGMKKEDAEIIKTIKYHATIYDDYVE